MNLIPAIGGDSGNNIFILTGTSANTINNGSTLSYPTGCDDSNCIIIGLMYYYNSAWRVFEPTNPLSSTLQPQGIVTVTRASQGQGIPYKVALYKYA